MIFGGDGDFPGRTHRAWQDLAANASDCPIGSCAVAVHASMKPAGRLFKAGWWGELLAPFSTT